MEDQVSALRALGIKAGVIGGSASRDDEIAAARGDFPILYCTPEKIVRWQHGLQMLRRNVRIVCIAVDESHCISEWGHDFRPEYRQLGDVREQLLVPNSSTPCEVEPIPIVALTATATEKVRQDIIKNLQLMRPQLFLSSFNRPNLKYFCKLRSSDCFDLIMGFLDMQYNCGLPSIVARGVDTIVNYSSTLVYVGTRKLAEELAAALQTSHHLPGIRVGCYHAGMS